MADLLWDAAAPLRWATMPCMLWILESFAT